MNKNEKTLSERLKLDFENNFEGSRGKIPIELRGIIITLDDANVVVGIPYKLVTKIFKGKEKVYLEISPYISDNQTSIPKDFSKRKQYISISNIDDYEHFSIPGTFSINKGLDKITHNVT